MTPILMGCHCRLPASPRPASIQQPTVKTLLACTLPLLVLPACNTVKETGRSRFLITSEREEIGLGADAYRQILSESKVVKGTPDAQMVARVGQRIAAAAEMGGYDYEWEFNLIDAPDSVNAFALPGGKVAIYTGILPITSNEDGLAAVMGHEIAHVTARHGGERMSQQFAAGVLTAAAAIGLEESDLDDSTKVGILAALGVGAQFGVLLPYSRTHESEADEIGLRFMIRAGYDPFEAPKLWLRMARLNPNRPPVFMSTHPDPVYRARSLEEMIPRLLAEERPGKSSNERSKLP